MSASLAFHEIEQIDDDLLLPWLDLYECAFPVDEKVLVSNHLKALKDRARRLSRDRHLFAALDDRGALVGMARYDVTRGSQSAYLIYLAVSEARRNTGIGSQFYREICRRLHTEDPPLLALLFEVERPDQAHSTVGQKNAARRIQFYQRAGARLLRGIHYVQQVHGQPPVPMHIMVHPLCPMDAQRAFELASTLFRVTRTEEPLSLD